MKINAYNYSLSKEDLFSLTIKIANNFIENGKYFIFDKAGNYSTFPVNIDSKEYLLKVIDHTTTDIYFEQLDTNGKPKINSNIPLIPSTESCILELEYNNEKIYFTTSCDTSSYIKNEDFGRIYLYSIYPVVKSIKTYVMWTTIY